MEQRVAVITGGSAGIGAAVTELLAARGTAVVPVARRKTELEAIAARAGGAVVPMVADVTRREEVHRVIASTLEQFGHIDVLINNVGRGITREPSQLTDDDVQEMMQVNVLSALYGMQEILPHFRSRGAGQIINVSSMLGRIPFAVMRSAYCGAKHFLNALTATFRAELKESDPGIQVTLVSPGVVRTEFGVNAKYGGPDSRQMPYSQSAEEVAAVIVEVIESPRADVYTREGARDRIVGYYQSLGVDP